MQKITYTYDAQGNRISKTALKNTGNKTYTWYVRDAQGNVMSAYSSQGNPADLASLPLTRSEVNLYGSSRIGMYSRSVNVDNGPRDMADSNSVKYYRGFRQYELSNHLGNVLATISDKKKPVDTNGDGQVDYYDADVTTAQDYYPFGMLMPGRIGYQSSTGWLSQPGDAAPDNGLAADVSIDSRTSNQPPEYTATNSVEMTAGFTSGTGDVFLAYISPATAAGDPESSGSSLNGGYRYGFNGKENDNEVKGTGNQQDYGARIYDDRLGRFLSVDPLYKDFAWNSTYAFAENSPIKFIDLDGEERFDYMYKLNASTGTAELKKITMTEVDAKGNKLPVSINYSLNGRNTSFSTINQFNDRAGNDALTNAALNKLFGDNKMNGGKFSENYYEDFGKFLFNTAISQARQGGNDDLMSMSKGITKVISFIDNEKGWGGGKFATVYHAYENIVGTSENTGYDKLLHFSFSAEKTFSFGSKIGTGLGYLKEAIKDEAWSWLPGVNDKGWDPQDIKANDKGVQYGGQLRNQYSKTIQEFIKRNPSSKEQLPEK